MGKLKEKGLSKHPLYQVYSNMKGRCNNESNANYHNYGGRGIALCKEWSESFDSFYDWSIAEGWVKGLQIDRINNNGNYEPSNCRFVTSKVNCRNKRNNRLLEFNGETKCLSEWSEITGVSISALSDRIKKGWKTEDVLSKKDLSEYCTVSINLRIGDKEEDKLQLIMKEENLSRSEAVRYAISKVRLTPTPQGKEFKKWEKTQ